VSTLYLIATPIGNREDITLRALRLLRSVDVVAAEDTRRTGLLLDHYGIKKRLISYHAHNQRARRDELLALLAAGDLALVSDAGTPGLSDPGHDLVAAALAAGHHVAPIPGPSALLAAVTASGLVPGAFTFVGFLPRRPAEARRALEPLVRLPHPLVFFEAPHRLLASLRLLHAALGDRPACAARELTKLHEEFRRGPLSTLLAHYETEPPRGEFVLIVDGAPPAEPEAGAAERILQSLIEAGVGPSQAAREAARRTGQARRALYALAQDLAADRSPTAEYNPADRAGQSDHPSKGEPP
jgi:16S rRNA (cytidine1402-2'-O)-methyltransferase